MSLTISLGLEGRVTGTIKTHANGGTELTGTASHALTADAAGESGWSNINNVCFLKDTKILLNNSEYKIII